MMRAGALLLLCAALLLIAGGKCDDICPPLRDTVDLFISGRHGAYIEQVEKYNKTSDVPETADTLKSYADKSLTAEDKQDALSALFVIKSRLIEAILDSSYSFIFCISSINQTER
ncbi:hypothetical protein MG293_015301 [Ovis ammon polii]|uniref:Major allergen I polypeptide chain 1-like n=2 Tax=Ovis TaxID=9935 RepID=A0A835ZTF5_SHEEP|nr:hypothetical protein JEQ12_005189 [Ovis aries]KAI4534441.1 hypothetical protein MG293_015301 [Ovis ammon polii]KAI4558695.1 hypothetical protein MJT46_013337 [Ovis ammon polii x Ovis aries]